MELGTAVALAYNLLNEHDLVSQGWNVKLNRGARRLGLCSWKKKLIKLSRHHVLNGTDDEVIDTIRHEVAHALAGPIVKHHGPEWQAWARKLGCRPRANAKSVSYQMPYKFILHCPLCAKDIQKRHNRVSHSRLRHLMCRKCGMPSLGRLILRRYVNASPSLLQPS